jgi:geranylgeranyl pyrophosphate synthase
VLGQRALGEQAAAPTVVDTGAGLMPHQLQRMVTPTDSLELRRHRSALTAYIHQGYRHATGHPMPPDARTLVEQAAGLDTSMLIIDDLLDESRERAGRPCHFRIVGTKQAIVDAAIVRAQAIDSLSLVMHALATPVPQRLGVMERVHRLEHSLYTGQRLDLEARGEPGFRRGMLNRYFRMTRLFTTARVLIGLEIGQLLSGRPPDRALSTVADAVGMIVRIREDFDDYFDLHHEPFGDFRAEANRLPELLFKQSGGNRASVLAELDAGKLEAARALVLTAEVRRALRDRCLAEHDRITAAEPAFETGALIRDIERFLGT